MEYTAVIRTLGTAGEKYQRELDSLCAQTIPPKEIIVYIAEGYPIPEGTCGKERYVYVRKGMVAQRALSYKEVSTEYILFLDDDVFLPPMGVEHLYNQMNSFKADVIAPNTFENFNMSPSARRFNLLLGKFIPFKDDDWIYRVARTGGCFYNKYPVKDFYWSESNAGPCFLCKKVDFLNIHYEDDLWLDDTPYALPDDQVLFYKMHLNGLKIGTSMDSGIVHLDAGTAHRYAKEREERLLYSEVRNQIIFWNKYIRPFNKGILSVWSVLCINYYKYMRLLLALRNKYMGNDRNLKIVRKAIKDAVQYIEKSKV